ncbi:hypothetical protein GE21DRAFT_1222173, partial [Neurospora crassa]
ITEDSDIIFLKPGYPFFIRDSLIYNYGGSTNNLYIPYKYVKEILEAAYNNKYYFGYNRIIYNLKGVFFTNKIQLIK